MFSTISSQINKPGVNLVSQNCILDSYLVVLNDFLMFENKSKFEIFYDSGH